MRKPVVGIATNTTGTYAEAVPYVYNGTSWVLAYPKVYNGGWQQVGGAGTLHVYFLDKDNKTFLQKGGDYFLVKDYVRNTIRDKSSNPLKTSDGFYLVWEAT